jgi:hypothetical protein
MTMNQPDDAGGDGDSMAADVAAEMDRHTEEMTNIMANYGVTPEGDDGEGSQPD